MIFLIFGRSMVFLFVDILRLYQKMRLLHHRPEDKYEHWKMLGQWFFYCGIMLFGLLGRCVRFMKESIFFLLVSSQWDKLLNAQCSAHIAYGWMDGWPACVFYDFWFRLIKIIQHNIFILILVWFGCLRREIIMPLFELLYLAACAHDPEHSMGNRLKHMNINTDNVSTTNNNNKKKPPHEHSHLSPLVKHFWTHSILSLFFFFAVEMWVPNATHALHYIVIVHNKKVK